MTRPVVGIDPSLRSTGIAVLHHPAHRARPVLATVGENGRRGATATDHDQRLRRQVDRVLSAIPPATGLVVIEGLAYASKVGAAAERAALFYMLRAALNARATPIATCPPQTRARFATGKGNAPKTRVLAALRDQWPDLTIRNDNEADALALATAGQMWLGWTRPALDHQRDALSAIEWPTRPARPGGTP